MTLSVGLLIGLIVPVLFTVLSLRTRNFYFNVGVTASCAVLVALSPAMMNALPVLCFFVLSIVGDYFMGHQGKDQRYYLFGIAGFFCAHGCLIWYSAARFANAPWVIWAGVALAVAYGLYLALRILPNVLQPAMVVAIGLYAAISLAALLTGAAQSVPMLQRVLYALGVAMIVFSDTMICEVDFAHNSVPQPAIMPTYFLCHILVAASILVSGL